MEVPSRSEEEEEDEEQKLDPEAMMMHVKVCYDVFVENGLEFNTHQI
jgi:hypothetical protein